MRVTVVATHAAQYFSPWFRFITEQCPAIDLTVLYASSPNQEQQGVGFGRAFTWDTELSGGYRSIVVRPGHATARFDSDSFRGLDVPEIGQALLDTRPDVAMVPGWHSITLVRAIRAARRAGVPVLYRGDTHNGTGPTGIRRRVWDLRTRVVLGLYSGYLAVGTMAREYLLTHGCSPTRIHASPHAVDNDGLWSSAAPWLEPDARREARTSLGVGPADFAVLFVGKLLGRKRPLDAVHAVARLGPNAVLVCVGTGRLDPDVRALAARLRVRVTMAGFLNQTEIGRAYAAADCLVLPSATESWGLVVNEAMATGLPAVVSDRVGCAPDLVVEGETGSVAPLGDVSALGAALERVRVQGGRTTMSAACRRIGRHHSYQAATDGLLAGCEAVTRRAPRVLACCGGMVIVSGAERLTFEVLGVARAHGAPVHCIVNSWLNERIVRLARTIAASWSIGFYYYGFSLRSRNPLRYLEMVVEILRTSTGLLRDAWRFRPTIILMPEHVAVLRNGPALLVLRAMGIPILLRTPTVPEPGRTQTWLWRTVSTLVSHIVCNSLYTRARLLSIGIPADRISLVRNRLVHRPAAQTREPAPPQGRRRLLVVGQVAPFKGTHLAVDAALTLLAEGVDVELLVVGQEPDWPESFVEYVRSMKAAVEAASAADRVRFVGLREDVPGLMCESHLLLAPFIGEESFGNVVLEALAAGLPVVTFATGGHVELVEDRVTGFVCPTHDLDGLLSGIRYYLDDAVRTEASRRARTALASPEHDCNPRQFDAAWWRLLSGGSARDGSHRDGPVMTPPVGA